MCIIVGKYVVVLYILIMDEIECMMDEINTILTLMSEEERHAITSSNIDNIDNIRESLSKILSTIENTSVNKDTLDSYRRKLHTDTEFKKLIFPLYHYYMSAKDLDSS